MNDETRRLAERLKGVATPDSPIYVKAVVELDADIARLTEANRVMREALDGLLDGLDANVDERSGLTNEQWEQRIAFARAALAQASEQS